MDSNPSANLAHPSIQETKPISKSVLSGYNGNNATRRGSTQFSQGFMVKISIMGASLGHLLVVIMVVEVVLIVEARVESKQTTVSIMWQVLSFSF